MCNTALRVGGTALAVVFACIGSRGVAGTYSSAVLADGPVGYYRLNETNWYHGCQQWIGRFGDRRQLHHSYSRAGRHWPHPLQSGRTEAGECQRRGNDRRLRSRQQSHSLADQLCRPLSDEWGEPARRDARFCRQSSRYHRRTVTLEAWIFRDPQTDGFDGNNEGIIAKFHGGSPISGPTRCSFVPLESHSIPHQHIPDFLTAPTTFHRPKASSLSANGPMWRQRTFLARAYGAVCQREPGGPAARPGGHSTVPFQFIGPGLDWQAIVDHEPATPIRGQDRRSGDLQQGLDGRTNPRTLPEAGIPCPTTGSLVLAASSRQQQRRGFASVAAARPVAGGRSPIEWLTEWSPNWRRTPNESDDCKCRVIRSVAGGAAGHRTPLHTATTCWKTTRSRTITSTRRTGPLAANSSTAAPRSTEATSVTVRLLKAREPSTLVRSVLGPAIRAVRPRSPEWMPTITPSIRASISLIHRPFQQPPGKSARRSGRRRRHSARHHGRIDA